MKAIVLPKADSSVPRIQIKAEDTVDESVFNSILNRNGEAGQPDAGYTIISFERNGDSFQSVTFGRNEDAISGSTTGSFIIAADGSASYQLDELIDKRILSLFIDNGVRTPDEYTYNPTTGALVFVSAIASGRVIQGVFRTLV